MKILKKIGIGIGALVALLIILILLMAAICRLITIELPIINS